MENKIKITDLTVQMLALDKRVTYVILHTNFPALKGYGLSLNNDIDIKAIHTLKDFIIDKELSSITEHMGDLWRKMKNNSSQASSILINAVWDLWARRVNKPLWRHIVDMSPEELVHCLDFTSTEHEMTPEDALAILRRNALTKSKRIVDLLAQGYPASTNKNDPVIDRAINEVLTAMLMGAKFNKPVHSYSGVLGVQHLAMVDYIYISGSLDNRVLEYSDQLHEHFMEPAIIKNGYYQVPMTPGYTSLLKFYNSQGQGGHDENKEIR